MDNSPKPDRFALAAGSSGLEMELKKTAPPNRSQRIIMQPIMQIARCAVVFMARNLIAKAPKIKANPAMTESAG
jgi:hypothetical protein